MNLNYKKIGESGPELVIIHGFLGSLDNWYSVAKKLGQDYTVYLLDARNHGLSPHDDEFSYPIMAQDVKEFLEQHNIGKASIIGHSMGGKIAMEFALEYPSLIDNLIVVDIAPKAYPVHHREILDALLGLDIDHLQSRQEADEQLAKSIDEFGVRQFLLKNIDRKAEGGFRWKMNLKLLNEKVEEVGKSQTGYSTVPTLFVRGERSDYIKDTDENDILEIFPNSTFADLPTGHWVHAEKPDLFYEVAVDFLDKR